MIRRMKKVEVGKDKERKRKETNRGGKIKKNSPPQKTMKERFKK